MKTELSALCGRVVALLTERGITFSTAESCTGGGIGAAVTQVSGASAVYRGGVISYCNDVKHRLLKVSQQALDTLGPVSQPVACQMAEGVRAACDSDYGLSVTGLAGPNGDGSGKPVGLVYIGCAGAGGTVVWEFHFSGGREQVRQQAVIAALTLLTELVTQSPSGG